MQIYYLTNYKYLANYYYLYAPWLINLIRSKLLNWGADIEDATCTNNIVNPHIE